jgi:hypothetical protein
MNKDVIYIDVEDDITAIIGKIKSSNEKIIALVPPKRVGILQSAVNLRLLERMASNGNKRLVLITNNQALIALAAAAAIPVAKNLQSKPELAAISALHIDDEDDVIDGSQLPIGYHANTAPLVSVVDKSIDDDIETIDIEGPNDDLQSIPINSKAKKKGPKIPNFNSFRKKLFLGIAAGIGLIALLIWMFVFAPSATIIITARTTDAPVNTTVTLGGNAATDASKGIIQSKTQQLKKDVSVEFDATGTKNTGEKATGTVELSQQSLNETTVPAGTQMASNNGSIFVTDVVATVPASTFVGPGCFPTACAGTASVAVTALNGGISSNDESGNLTGEPSGIAASFTGATSGGTDKVSKVVSASDITLATDKLKAQPTEESKKALIKQFTNGEVVIDDSFSVEYAAPVSVPALDAEAPTGKAKLTSNVTYTIFAIAKPDLEVFLQADLEKQIAGKTSQRVYDTGIDNVKLSGYAKTGVVSTVKIIATGQIGPKIDEEEVKQQVKGMRFGEVQETIGAIDGVSDVDVEFSYFWVRTVPNNTDKISVEFKLQDE